MRNARRSPKAGRPPETPAATPQVRRRRKSAVVTLDKGTTLLQVERGPRALTGAKGPKFRGQQKKS
jgi:hypothetical protein